MWRDLAGVSLSLLISSLDAGPSSHQPSLTTHQKMSRRPLLSVSRSDDSRQHYKEAFSAFDWTNSGRISYGSLKVHWNITRPSFYHQFCFLLKAAMRRCGQNPTDIEVSDIINKIHDDSGSLDLEVTLEFLFFTLVNQMTNKWSGVNTCQDFYNIMENRSHDMDPETGYKVGLWTCCLNLKFLLHLLGMFPSFQ